MVKSTRISKTMMRMMTMTTIDPERTQEIEIFSQNTVVTVVPNAQMVAAVATADMSLPAALCDDLLLEEINSIPDKMGFKIGDVADMLGVKQYVLRYWESEFDVLKPKKASNNQRLYTRKDVENSFLIRKLLHRDRFSIEGARHAMRELKAYVKKEKDFSSVVNKIDAIRERLEDLAMDIRRTRQIFK